MPTVQAKRFDRDVMCEECMELTKWFCCGTDGRPIRAGWYQWELFLVDERGIYNIIETMAQYVPGIDFVVVNGRAVGITDEDHWRGLTHNAIGNGRAGIIGTSR